MPSQGPDSPRPRSCVNCGAPLSPDSRFCSACGAEVPTPPLTPAEQLLEQLRRERAAASAGPTLPPPVGRPPLLPVTPPLKKGRNRLTCFLVSALGALLLCACGAVWLWQSADSLFGITVTTSKASATPSPLPARAAVSLSAEQKETLEEFGLPHSFTIVEADDAEGDPIRVEDWRYLDAGMVYTFVDGGFHAWEPLEAITGGLEAAPYHPAQFALGDGVDEVYDYLEPAQWEPLEGLGALIEGAEVYATKQLVLTFQDDRLVMVDAAALALDGG